MKMWTASGALLSLVVCATGQDYNGGGLCPIPGAGPDVTLCEFYGFQAIHRVSGGSSAGIASGATVGTTSWNIGTVQLLWDQSPDPDHPKITMNVYRLLDGRFENIAGHWTKHGFLALSNEQCTDAAIGSCQTTNGSRLGLACTDTYNPLLNAGMLAPRYEINPWTGGWSYTNSIFETGGAPTYAGSRLMQLEDADLDAAANPGARYFVEGYYVTADDICIYNSASYKEVFITSIDAGGIPNFTMESDRFTPPHQLFAILDVWTGATLTEIAQDMALIRGISPDGRAIVGAHITALGNGAWRYDYTVMNIDMDRQMDQFWVDLPDGVTVTDLYFYAPKSHEETLTYEFGGGIQGPPRSNDAWPGTVEVDKVRWATKAHQAGVASNPIGWGTAYSFGFTADTAPTTGTMNVTPYRFNTGVPITGATQAPSAALVCPGDLTGDGRVDLDDLSVLLFGFGAQYDLSDLQLMLFQFGGTCINGGPQESIENRPREGPVTQQLEY